MAKQKRKRVLNAALKALLAGVQTSAAIKIPATFISELASLPDDKQKVLAELTPEQFNQLLTQSELATINAAASAADAKQIKSLLKELLDKFDKMFGSVSRKQKSLIHNLPYTSIGGLFKGRDDVLEELKRDLARDKPTAITQTIQGLGGIGKTRLAVEFGWWALENKKYRAVFFVRSETPELLRASLASLAGEKVLDLGKEKEEEQIGSVMRWLNDNTGWLMILDNADTEDAAEAVEAVLPRLARGHVIITSRHKRWSGSVLLRQLELLDPADAKQFLLDRTAGRRIQTAQDDTIASQLADELGYLPLALEQAAAYIVHNQSSLSDYLRQWQADKDQVLTWYNEREMKYPASAAVTWQRTYTRLTPVSQTVLHLAGFLAPEPIPEQMFLQNTKIIAEAVKLLADKPTPKKSKPDVKEALSELAAYSMIDRQENTFTVHRIVQHVMRSRIPKERLRNWLQKVLQLVNNFAPTESGDVRTWPVWDVLRPHAELIAEAADNAKITDPTFRLMAVLGTYLHYKGLYDKSERWKRRTLAIDEASFGKDQPEVATALNNLAQLLADTNRLSEAEPLMRRALKIDEDSFGKDQPEVATALNNLAQLLKDTNRLSEAEPLMRRALKIAEDSFGKDHPKVAIRLNNLAGLLAVTNRLSEAEPMYRRVVEIFEKSLGENHPNVATALNNLAQLLADTNRLSEAEPLMRRVVKILENPGGDPLPNYAGALNNLAELLRETNRLDEAEPLYKRALKIDEDSLGPNHPDVAIDLNNLAVLLKDTNRLSEAEPLCRRVVEIFEKSLGENHPNVATALNNLAQLLKATNRLSEAKPLMRRALKIFEDSLGPNHPSTKTTRNNLRLLK
jgi:tetratricopeptide (TPR) repeat protein